MDLIENTNVDQNVKRHPWELSRLKIIENEVINMCHNINPQKIILIDIGCGDAFVINNLSKKIKFKKAFAVDINFNEENINKLNNNLLNIKFYNSLENVEISDSETYIVILNDVIEHIDEHKFFLENLNHIFFKKVKKVSFFITVPAFNFLFSEHDKDLGHYRRYTRENLIEYNKILEMKINSSGYFFISLFLVRFFQKYFFYNKVNKTIGVSGWAYGKIITNTIAYLLFIDYKIGKLFSKFSINIPGLSSYIIFEK
jgi:hypothetical protein